MLHTLNLHSTVYQLYINKTKRKIKTIFKKRTTVDKKYSPFPNTLEIIMVLKFFTHTHTHTHTPQRQRLCIDIKAFF